MKTMFGEWGRGAAGGSGDGDGAGGGEGAAADTSGGSAHGSQPAQLSHKHFVGQRQVLASQPPLHFIEAASAQPTTLTAPPNWREEKESQVAVRWHQPVDTQWE